eukprot:gb/GECH01001371.1/.p1 GENE.gb/GECH01001371.1/~~gb/GECH01001371.1/.p1  ORF type:complete len:272 (+),score=26.63 gb/GECH01001371.1/:1-816(+)
MKPLSYDKYRSYFGNKICQLNAHCRNVLFPNQDQIYGLIIRNLFLPSKKVVGNYSRDSSLKSIGLLPEHLRQWLKHFNNEEYESTNSQNYDNIENENTLRPSVIGIHLRFGDQAKRETSPEKTRFINKDQFPDVLDCLSKMIQEQMLLKNNTQKAHLLIATDHNDAISQVKKYIQKEFQDRVIVHFTPGVPRHSGFGYKSCSHPSESSFIKVFHDIIMLCHSDKFIGTQNSSLSIFIANYCSSDRKHLENYNLFNLPSTCNNLKEYYHIAE